ncbi:MAG TPA: lipid A deacylase LpxR family protein [Bacteroides sp.]|nr:lipid A deacylase LpxR family protein [Bacteroides sp.]
MILLILGLAASAQEQASRNGFVFSFENDMFNRMDWYFSNGINIALYHEVLGKSPLNRILLPLRIRETDRVYYGLRLRQEIYTPRDISQDEIQPGDHPYAATLSLSSEKIVMRPASHMRFTSGLQLGVLGPAALGFHAQKLIHNITPSDPPQGWDNQVGNDLMLNYNVTVDKGVVEDEYSQFILHGRARLGTVYTDATAGFLVRMEYQPKYFSFIDPDPARRFNIYVEFGGNLRFVGYDASLQGGMFNRTSPYTIPSESVSRIVAEGRINIVLELPKHQLVFYENVVSPRFDASEWHAWLGISYRYWW